MAQVFVIGNIQINKKASVDKNLEVQKDKTVRDYWGSNPRRTLPITERNDSLPTTAFTILLPHPPPGGGQPPVVG